MRPSETQNSINLKLILICFLCLLFFLLVFKSNFTPFRENHPSPILETHVSSSTCPATEEQLLSPACPSLLFTPTCTKTPPSLAQALVHYATLNVTPQQTFNEISVTSRVLQKKAPCNFLVFGLGHDSLMWTALNHGGRTVFLEEDKSWMERIKQKFPSVESYYVVYDTKVHEADELLEVGMGEDCKVVADPRFSKYKLSLKGFPNEVYDVEWDLIMVDAPTGYHDEAPGRMGAIYTAGLMGRNREDGETDVFVHNVNRVVEDKFSKAFLCEGYFREQEGRIGRFTIPSHRTRSRRSFCP
eukprot:XP_010646548.1 PREDICTED: glucuronoxylan 4-O-methyltransferase 2 [Vitis vinifera]